MEARPTLSDINVSENINWYDQAPQVIQSVLRKIDDTELSRARQYIAEEVGIVLTRVNASLYSLRLANAVLEEENGKIVSSSDPNERERRNETLEDIQNFLKSSLETRTDLAIVLEHLQNINEDFLGLEEDTKFKEVRNITGAWVEMKDAEIWRSMSNIESGVLRIRQLCKHFFNIKAKKATKEKNADKKATDVWYWWRETRVDARMLLKIQELQPPSTKRMLQDAQLGIKAASDLSFMLEDMAKSFAHNKAMNMAFQFAQTGLSNLSRALKERSQEVQALQNEVDRLQSQETPAEMERLRNKLNMANEKTTQLTQENNTLKGNNAWLLKQCEELKNQAPVKVEYFVDSQDYAPTPTPPPPPPPPQPTKPVKRWRSIMDKVKTELKQAPQIIYVEKERSEKKSDEPVASPQVVEEDPKETKSPVSEEAIAFKEVEKKNKRLLSTFQDYIFDLMKNCLENNMPAQLEKMDLDAHKANDAMQLYQTLQNTLRATFEETISNLNVSFSTGMLDLPVMDEHLKKSEYFNNTATPGQMLQDVRKSLKTRDEDFENASGCMQNLLKDSLDPAEGVFQQLQSIHNKGKEQSCKMLLVWENLTDVYNDVHSKPASKVETKMQQCPQKHHLPPLPPVSEKPRDQKKIRQLSHKEVAPPEMLGRVGKSRVVKINTQQPLEMPQIQSKPFRELLKHYEQEIVSEGERIMRGEMRGSEYQLSMASQMTNLRILHQALLNKNISSELYCFAKDLIKCSLSANEMRLTCLMRKFIAFRALQQIRSNLNVRVISAREYNDGPELRDLYIFLTKIEWYNNSVMQRWRVKQMTFEDKRHTCLAKILYLFRKFELDLGVNLIKPYVPAEKSKVQQFPTLKPQLTLNVSPYHHSPQPRVTPYLTKPELGALPQPHVRELGKPKATATWSFNITMDNMQLARKHPVMLDVPPTTFPRLLEMDITRSRQRALRIAQARVMAPVLSRGDM
ncbi:uncharacterized protein LOC121713465 [Alosa sapidissima]|uniref:uncharacterized protein LOC121713465 n=1 Tax=Alosa sapidissima TaxID=34773 RepID=UPI001C0896AE|nr:uncharacterized protein LOC121713465 [Alosa sapidissima]